MRIAPIWHHAPWPSMSQGRPDPPAEIASPPPTSPPLRLPAAGSSRTPLGTWNKQTVGGPLPHRSANAASARRAHTGAGATKFPYAERTRPRVVTPGHQPRQTCRPAPGTAVQRSCSCPAGVEGLDPATWSHQPWLGAAAAAAAAAFLVDADDHRELVVGEIPAASRASGLGLCRRQGWKAGGEAVWRRWGRSPPESPQERSNARASKQ